MYAFEVTTAMGVATAYRTQGRGEVPARHSSSWVSRSLRSMCAEGIEAHGQVPPMLEI
jgi:hypothetical protein